MSGEAENWQKDNDDDIVCQDWTPAEVRGRGHGEGQGGLMWTRARIRAGFE